MGVALAYYHQWLLCQTNWWLIITDYNNENLVHMKYTLSGKYLENQVICHSWNDNLYVDHEKWQPKMDIIHDFMTFIRFLIIICLSCNVQTNQLSLIIDYWSITSRYNGSKRNLILLIIPWLCIMWPSFSQSDEIYKPKHCLKLYISYKQTHSWFNYLIVKNIHPKPSLYHFPVT